MTRSTHIFNLVLALGMILCAAVSCTKETPVPDASRHENTPLQDESEICYRTPGIEDATKAVITGTVYPDIPFYSWAKYYPYGFDSWEKGEIYMDKAKVEKDVDNRWRTNPKSYWPKAEDATLAFFGLSHGASGLESFPAGASVGVNEEGVFIKDYAIKLNDSQEDMMVSDAVINQTSGVVVQNFNHVLSTVKFEVRLSKDFKETLTETDDALATTRSERILSFKLKRFYLTNIVNQGDFTQGLSAAEFFGDYEGEQVKGDMRWNVSNKDEHVVSYDDLITDPAGLLINRYSDDPGLSYVIVNEKANIILPQMTYRGKNRYVELYIEYDVETEVTTKVGSAPEDIETITTTQLREIDLNNLGFREFECGKSYTFRLTVSRVNVIDFSIIVGPWTELPVIHL